MSELRAIGPHESDLIEELFQEVYKKEQGINYWKWCFKNPYGYLTTGIFEKNRLIGYYAAHLTESSAVMCTAMVHPKHQKKGIYWKMMEDLDERISLLRDYYYLFSNSIIRPIHIEKEKCIEVYQIKEYRIPANTEFFEETPPSTYYIDLNEYESWRYSKNLFVQYIFHYDNTTEHKAIFSLYEDRLQIVDFNYDVYEAINVGKYLAKAYNKEFIAFWTETIHNFPYVKLPTWKHYKILNPKNIDMEDIMINDKLRMGLSDVF